ncbi:hypothetical protein [Rhizobium leguminosarum]|uniref:hypothetical protein n=1 Tax=Rhizobium leguminosarum TaxID=384 RepID=UPI001C942A7A|nr:hypothetical protein [Rhizobium leguminosarum]MBY5750820.1 hypothetical protein [Rhizobium leguminosarum]
MPQTAAIIWADGPATSPYEPAKSDIRDWGTWIESIISAFIGNGGLVYTSQAALFADLAHGANSSAWVIGDANAALNGIYMKVGGSGAGSWTRVADLPYSFVDLFDAGAGTPNAIQLTSTIPTSASVLRTSNVFETNTGNVTVSENGGSAKALLTSSGNQIAPGGLLAGMMIVYVDDGSAFRLLTDQASAAIVTAAEAAQAAAETAAADALAAAAGVNLPSVAANRMLVDNAAGTARESKTFSQVMTLLAGAVSGVASAFSLDNNTLYKVRSLKDRWLDSYRLAEELQFTGGGATATDAAVLQALFNRAKAAGRGEIILPRGDIALEAAVSIFEDGTRPIRIVGQGPNQTRFLNTAASQKFFNIGDAAQARTKDITFEGCQLHAAVVQDSAGRGFNLRNTTDISFKDVLVDGMKNGWALGEGAGASNDAVYTSLVNCGGDSPGVSSSPLIILGSGAVLSISGGAYRWNANGGHIFIHQYDASWNWDGVYVSHQVFEAFDKYLYATGKGIVNADWGGGQIDRHTIGFHAEPAIASGSNRNWMIHHVQILGGPTSAGIGVLASVGVSTDSRAIENIRIQDNNFENHTGQAIWLNNGGGIIQGNTFDNCGYNSVPVIKVGQPITRGYVKIDNNVGFRHPSSAGAGYTYGIQWDGAAHLQRSESNNRFYDYVSGQQNGTM